MANNTNESTEWAQFALQAPGTNGASSNWNLADSTCDGSFKTDVIYRIDPPAADPSMSNQPEPSLLVAIIPTS
jgi:hypothetical protein